jgi:hypothetical protein
LLNYILTSFIVRSEIRSKKIIEKEDLQDSKQDKQFDQDNDPELPANGHTAETIPVKIEGF